MSSEFRIVRTQRWSRRSLLAPPLLGGGSSPLGGSSYSKANHMLQRTLFCLIISLVPQFILAQTIHIESLSNHNFLAVSFSDSLHGWVGGDNTFLRTADGGITWMVDSLAAHGGYFSSVKAVDQSQAWVVWQNGLYSYVARTTNAGLKWDTVFSEFNGTISHTTFTLVDALDSLQAWVCGWVSYICVCPAPAMKTLNAGSSWSSFGLMLFGYPSVSFTALKVFSDSVAATLFNGRQLYHTVNGGQKWSCDSLTQTFNEIAIPEENHIWLAGDSGTVLLSTDNGASWNTQATHTRSNLLSITALNKLNAWAVGSHGTFVCTSDGGSTWDSVATHTNQNLNAVFYSDLNHGWMVGDSGVVLTVKYGLVSSVQRNPLVPVTSDLLQNYPNPFNPATTITYDLVSQSQITLDVFDELGRRVDILIDGPQTPGSHSLNWSPRNLTSGVYFLRLVTPQGTFTKKLILLK